MKIGFIMPHLNYGVGGVRRIIEVSNHLQKFGHDVRMFTPTGNPCRWITNSIPTFKLSNLQKHTLDVSTFTLAEQYFYAERAKATKKVFWVLAPEAMYKSPHIPIKALQKDFLFFTNSVFTRDYILKYRKDPIKYEIPIIPGGLNTEHFKYDPEIKKEYHILYFGSKRPWKGKMFIEDALSGLKLKVLRMEGSNTPQNEMYRLYNKCNMYISACTAEGFSMPQLEAMACGCAVVTTDDGGSRDFIKHEYNAIVIQKTRDKLIAAINSILQTKELRRKIIKNGLITAAQTKFKWDNIAKQFEKVISG